ncbi:MAG: peptidylprolyl isomerase [Burkholderiales bacterium]
MDTSLTTPMTAQPQTPARSVPAWLREPLLHFVLLGGLLFTADHFLMANADDPHTIVVGAEVDKEARDTFKAARGQEPDAKQLAALRQIWLDNEVLYREGLALRVDQGDATIRERVIFKALNIVEAGLKLPEVDDKTLNAWFEAHRDKYDEPARYDFQEAALSGDSSETTVRSFVNELNTGTGSTRAGLRVFKGRPYANLVQGYGAEAAKAIEDTPAGEWRAVPTRDGWRAMRMDAVTAAKAASFEGMRNVVLQDWTDATMAELRTAGVRALAKKYKVRFEGDKT